MGQPPEGVSQNGLDAGWPPHGASSGTHSAAAPWPHALKAPPSAAQGESSQSVPGGMALLQTAPSTASVSAGIGGRNRRHSGTASSSQIRDSAAGVVPVAAGLKHA